MPLEAKTAGTSKIAKNFFKKDQTTNLDQTEKITFIEQIMFVNARGRRNKAEETGFRIFFKVSEHFCQITSYNNCYELQTICLLKRS